MNTPIHSCNTEVTRFKRATRHAAPYWAAYMIRFDIMPDILKNAAASVLQIAMKPYHRRGDMAVARAVKSIGEYFCGSR